MRVLLVFSVLSVQFFTNGGVAPVTLRSDAAYDSVIERVKKHFDDNAIVELTALIAFQNLSSKFNSTLGVPPQGFCRIPLE
jgi:alkylhydroperoxidase family enzyme